MEIVTIKMLKNQKGSPDGCVVRDYEKGQQYNLPKDLADAFIGMKVAKLSAEVASKEIADDIAAEEAAIAEFGTIKPISDG